MGNPGRAVAAVVPAATTALGMAVDHALAHRDTKRRRHVLSLIAVGVVVVSLAVYAGTQLPGDRNDHKGTADGKPDQTSIHKPPTDGSASPGRSPTPPSQQQHPTKPQAAAP
ncbi:hypothetical protein ACIQWV_36000 [Streptomyces sp. NPDC098085]|uniref:hypothetical protein n=1 Tax=Streptomyces sp. NPDC098085 TaxID=3366094 RepID=UPI00381656FE